MRRVRWRALFAGGQAPTPPVVTSYKSGMSGNGRVSPLQVFGCATGLLGSVPQEIGGGRCAAAAWPGAGGGRLTFLDLRCRCGPASRVGSCSFCASASPSSPTTAWLPRVNAVFALRGGDDWHGRPTRAWFCALRADAAREDRDAAVAPSPARVRPAARDRAAGVLRDRLAGQAFCRCWPGYSFRMPLASPCPLRKRASGGARGL